MVRLRADALRLRRQPARRAARGHALMAAAARHVRALRCVRGDRRAAARGPHQRRRPRARHLVPAAVGGGGGDRRDVDLRRPGQLLGGDLRRADPHGPGLVPEPARRRPVVAADPLRRDHPRARRSLCQDVREAPMNRSVRAAVVGTGFIGVVHVEALRRLGIEVTGVVGSSPARAREKAKSAVLPEPYESFGAMLADERVDVVHITSPNKEHYPQAKAALEAGKHVVCEKPLAMNSRETGELLDLANRSGLVHAVNFNIRFYSQVIEAHERIARGDLGAVHQVTGSYLQDWLLLDTDWNWRLDPAEGGELRAVGDIGSHWIDLLQYVTGRRVEGGGAGPTTGIPGRPGPTRPGGAVARKGGAGGGRVPREITTEDIAAMLLRLDGGARAVCAVSQLSAGR